LARNSRGVEQRTKGWDRPWIEANGSQPLIAPRTQDMQGDPFGLLLRQRTIFMGGEVEDFGADALISQLLLLDSQDASKDIKFFINSPGGFLHCIGSAGTYFRCGDALVM
jgi:ATP-dependent Clp protease, protease subunit